MADILGIEAEIRNQLHLMDAEGTCKERPAEIDIERYLKRSGYTGYGYNIWHDDFQGFWRWSCNILKLKKKICK